MNKKLKALAWHFVHLANPGGATTVFTAVMTSGNVDRVYRIKSVRIDAMITNAAGYSMNAVGNFTLQAAAGQVLFNPADQSFDAFPPTNEETNVILSIFSENVPEVVFHNSFLYPGINYNITAQVYPPAVGTPFAGTEVITISLSLNLEYEAGSDKFAFQ